MNTNLDKVCIRHSFTVGLEAALAAVQQNEKIQSERQRQKEDELRKKKEKEAAQKAREEKGSYSVRLTCFLAY